MKKIIGLLLSFVLFVSCVVNGNAANIGDVVNETVYTDIVAKINGYDIASFNINGYTVIVAEDLRNYGFNVEWREAERALYITKNESAEIKSAYVAPKVSGDMVGVKANDVLYTDIKTYIDGNHVASYNIDGRTVIYFDDLEKYGEVYYDDATRTLYANLKESSASKGNKAEAFEEMTTAIEENGYSNSAVPGYYNVRPLGNFVFFIMGYIPPYTSVYFSLTALNEVSATVYVNENGFESAEIVFYKDGEVYKTVEMGYSDGFYMLNPEDENLISKKEAVELLNSVFKSADDYLKYVKSPVTIRDLGFNY